jgi:hypothetical protein
MLSKNLLIRLITELEINFEIARIDFFFKEVKVKENCGGTEVIRPVICSFRSVFKFVFVKLKSCSTHVG